MTLNSKSNSRRDFLKKAMTTLPVIGLTGSVSIPSLAAEDSEKAKSDYAPTYFSSGEWAFIRVAVDLLIPSNGDGPGALELGVPEFIDRQMDDAYGYGHTRYMSGPFYPDSPDTLGYQLKFTPRELYRVGIDAINQWTQSHHQKDFHALDANLQVSILLQLESGSIQLNAVPSKAFFNQLLTNTKEGYFADPMYGGNKNMGAWKMIGFPGARADFADWASQPGAIYPLKPVSIKG